MWRTAVFVSALAATLLAASPSSAQELGFVENEPVDLGENAVLTVVNDGNTALDAVRVTAMLHSVAPEASARVAVPVSVDYGEGFGAPAKGAMTPGQAILISLKTPDDAPRPAVGLVVVTARDPQGRTVVARHDLQITDEVVASGTSTWSAVSRAWLWEDGGGELGRPIPLQQDTECPGDGAAYEDYVVAGDRAVEVTLTCRNDALEVTTGAFPAVGTYKGTVSVGDEDVEVEVRHTRTVWFALLPLLLGFVLAVAVQRRMNGSDTQLRWWLRRLRKRAALADRAFLERASNADWDRYRIEPAVVRETAVLRGQLHDLRLGLPPWLRWLPWSPGEQEPQRQAIVESINDLDDLVSNWSQTPRDIKQAQKRLAASPGAPTRSPLLVARMAEVQSPEGDFSVEELRSRREFVLHLDGALDVVDQLVVVDDLLRGAGPVGAIEEWSPLDEQVLHRARQLVREAGAVLKELRSPSEVESDVEPLVSRASRLAARLPLEARRRGIAEATAGGADIVETGLVFVRKIAQAVSERSYVASQSALVLVALVVAVATGLALLYVGKAWGTPADFFAAFVWGFGATALLSPVLDLLRGLGDRPSGAPSGTAVGG